MVFMGLGCQSLLCSIVQWTRGARAPARKGDEAGWRRGPDDQGAAVGKHEMTEPLGQHTVLELGGRQHRDLPVDRDPLPAPGTTPWDEWAAHAKRRERVASRGTLQTCPTPKPSPS